MWINLILPNVARFVREADGSHSTTRFNRRESLGKLNSSFIIKKNRSRDKVGFLMYALLAVSIQRAEGPCGCFIQGLVLHLSGKLAMRSGVQHLEHFATCSPLFFHLERTLILVVGDEHTSCP